MGTSAKNRTLHYRILVFYLKRLFEIKFLRCHSQHYPFFDYVSVYFQNHIDDYWDCYCDCYSPINMAQSQRYEISMWFQRLSVLTRRDFW